jgi:ribosomal protein S18 acetylase RimI-like enzyme
MKKTTAEFLHDLPDRKAYFSLFLTTGWNEEYHFTEKEAWAAIRNSWYCISAYDGRRLVGFGRVISDGVHHALLVDIMVDPWYRGRGIGKKITLLLLEKCKKHRIRDIQLFAARTMSPFYQEMGFESRPPDAPGMHYHWPDADF